MPKQEKEMDEVINRLEEASKSLKQMTKTAGDDFREGVDKGRKAVMKHPKAALGIALGAAFAAGVVAAVELNQAKKKGSER